MIWLSVQECTGCSESLLQSFEPTLESLILDTFSLDYHHVLQAAGRRCRGGSDAGVELIGPQPWRLAEPRDRTALHNVLLAPVIWTQTN